jgi:hypothetical protein
VKNLNLMLDGGRGFLEAELSWHWNAIGESRAWYKRCETNKSRKKGQCEEFELRGRPNKISPASPPGADEARLPFFSRRWIVIAASKP